jgi:A/G-specific adenine glycosylase
MCQQTRVDTAIPYYLRFTERFPTLQSLAEAEPDEVLKLWENLGYYGRARRLQAAARQVAVDRDGRFPDDFQDILRLPGVGPYIAGAVASIAFGRPVPAVDGNAVRVFSRLFGVETPVDQGPGRKIVGHAAAGLAPRDRPGDFNQSVMELGARVCVPSRPDCPVCPLEAICVARAKGLEETLPIKSPSRAVPTHRFAAGVVFGGLGRVIVVQRPMDGFLGGLWQWPAVLLADGENPAERWVRHLRDDWGLDMDPPESLGGLRHRYSHFQANVLAFKARIRSGAPRPGPETSWRWVDSADLSGLAWSKVDREIMARISK